MFRFVPFVLLVGSLCLTSEAVLDKSWEPVLLNAAHQIEVVVTSVLLRCLGMHRESAFQLQLLQDDSFNNPLRWKAAAGTQQVLPESIGEIRRSEILDRQKVFLGANGIAHQEKPFTPKR